jgi:hypothetical protein
MNLSSRKDYFSKTQKPKTLTATLKSKIVPSRCHRKRKKQLLFKREIVSAGNYPYFCRYWDFLATKLHFEGAV